MTRGTTIDSLLTTWSTTIDSLLATRGTNIESHYKWHDARLLTLTVNDTRHDYWLSLLTYADLAIEENFYILDQLQNVHRHQYQVIGVMLL